MEKGLQIFASVNFLAIGLSHVLRRAVWLEYFAKLHSLGRVGAFAEGFLYLNFGTLIVSFHSIWSFPEAVLTIIGWALVIKGLLRFIAPDMALRLYARMQPERAWQLQFAGVVFLALSAFCAYLAL